MSSAQYEKAFEPPKEVGLGAPARVDRRIVDGKEVIVLLLRASSSYAETEAIIADARKRFAHLDQHIHHIELEMPPDAYAAIMRAQQKKARRALKAVK